MQNTRANSWPEFSEWLEMLEGERKRLREMSGLYVSEILFRGQADASWSLATTLERSYPNRLRVNDYYASAHSARHQIEAHLGQRWEIQSPDQYSKWVDDFKFLTELEFATFGYLLYLRHHGLPSPFLDWTESPYVAAYFALGHAAAKTDRIAIYAYLEYAGGAKGSSSRTPSIRTIGPNIRTHRRHFLQQSQYTYCTYNNGEQWFYTDHDSAFAAIRDEPQDLLWRFTLPVTERTAALSYLDKFNLNAFSLLGSEESLMETVAFRELGQRV